MGAASSEASSPPPGGRPLEPDRPDPQTERPESQPAQATGGSGAGGGQGSGAAPGAPAGGSAGGAGSRTGSAHSGGETPGGQAPGLIAQLKATKDALLAMLRAHVALGRAEAEAIKGEVVYAAAFAGVAVAVLLLLGIFLPVATMLFLGEWLFGSIGWGLLLGSEMLVVVAATAVVVGLKLDGPVPAAAIGGIAGIVAFIVLGASWFNRLWAWAGQSAGIALDPAYRPLVVGVAIVGIVIAIAGALAGARAAGAGGAIGGFVVGLIGGALVGAFLSSDFGWRVGAALGIATAFAVYLGALAARAVRGGLDTERLKGRFWPQQTIDTTRETIEWAKARNPLGPKS